MTQISTMTPIGALPASNVLVPLAKVGDQKPYNYDLGADLATRPKSADLADIANAAKGSALVGFGSSLSYAANTVGAFLKSLLASTGSSVIGFIHAGTGATARTAQDKLRDTVSALDFGAVGDGSTDDTAAIASALATGKTVLLPKTSTGQYNANVALTGGMGLIAEDGVIIHSANTTAALTLSGQKNFVRVGEVNAPSAANAVRYFNLQYSYIQIRRPGSCTTASIFHDASAQTVDEGNNRWLINDVQAGSVPYGIKIDSHATHTLEGETWDVIVILSATTAAMVIGSNGNDTCRFNEYHVSVDAQGITPMMLDIYNSSNGIYFRNWASKGPSPVADVRFNTGTAGNHLLAFPGVQGALVVLDSGTNSYSSPGAAGVRNEGGNRAFAGSVSIGGGTALTKAVAYAPSLTPSAVAAATIAEQTFTVTGLTTADKIIVNPPAIGNATGIAGARVSAADTLALRFCNPTAGSLTPSAGTYTVLALRS